MSAGSGRGAEQGRQGWQDPESAEGGEALPHLQGRHC